MNILNRPMFSQGDEVSKTKVLPLFEKHAKGNPIVDERGQDPLFDSFLDKYGIDAETYASIHQQAGNYVIYDPGLKTVAPGIELLFGAKGLGGLKNIFTKQGTKGTGSYVAETLPLGVSGPTRGFQEITKNVTELTPLGRNITVAASVPFVAGSARMPEDQEATEEETLIARNQDEVQAEIDLLDTKNKKDSENKKRKAEKTKIENEIKNIEDVINAIQGFDTKKSEAYQEEKARTRKRNTNIFLEEMSASMAATNNLADGIAIGAANAAKQVGEADEAESLAYAEFLEQEAEKREGEKLKPSDVNSIAKIYGEASNEIEKANLLSSEINKLKQFLVEKNVTGAAGFISRLGGKVEGLFGADGELRDATAAKNITQFLQARMVQAILVEKGKTISDADRKLIKDLIGNLESPVSNRAEVINLLNLVESSLNKTKADNDRIIKFYKAEYGESIPNLSIFDAKTNTTDSGIIEDNEVSIADQEDLIQ